MAPEQSNCRQISSNVALSAHTIAFKSQTLVRLVIIIIVILVVVVVVVVVVIAAVKRYATRRRGRPKMKWLDDVSMSLRKMAVSGWKDRARNREAWRRVVEEAKAHPRL
jgi:hypothetical protein